MNNLFGRFSDKGMVEITNDKWAGNIYYLNGVVLPVNKHFLIKVPNGGKNSTVTFNFVVDENYNTIVTSE